MNVNWEGILPIEGEIIVVEDDPMLRSLMCDIVKEIGAEAVAFDTADNALTYLLQGHGQCRLVIVDHNVPGQIQGTEFIQMVREKWPSIGAILTSGYLLDSTTIPPSTIYLLKPWSLDDLVIAATSFLQPDNPIHKI
ncbi:response regulator [Pseudomonas vancouverensis]|uniref:Response regulator n=1 Tax=Pseudomonas vancouverensis TaxID=95300 RepID=A0A4R4KAY9_PSEVA|nr:response regulator [Pseudomonas vancouverensis]KAB0496479.1 response regulator [Pseudomonas vancouverensis]TDB64813.1 response regulator [Pseudomonas vancouverensis]